MEIGMKEDKDVADEISLSNLVSRSTCNLAQSATKCTYLQFMVLEGKDCDKNLHEGEHGCCRRNEIIYNKMILTLQWGSHKFAVFGQKVVTQIIRFGQTSAGRRTWALSIIQRCWFLDHALAAHEARQNTLINSLRWPKVKDYDGNRHEGEDGCC